MAAAIEAMRVAFAALAEGRVQSPLRTALTAERGTTLIMPAALAGADAAVAVKVVSIFPENKRRGLPAIHGLVLVVDPETGAPLAAMHGGALTAIRTAAVCGLATALLARPNSEVLAVIGSGVQARTQIEAVRCVRRIREVRVCNPNLASAERFAEGLRGVDRVSVTERSAEALHGADIVCTATTATTPALADEDVPAGVHINAIGSYQPHVRELPSATVARSLLVVDEREAALEEAGDILQAIAEGAIAKDHIHCELGDLVLGRAAGRTAEDQITLFKSVGLAVQDVAASRAVLRAARKQGIGQEVEW